MTTLSETYADYLATCPDGELDEVAFEFHYDLMKNSTADYDPGDAEHEACVTSNWGGYRVLWLNGEVIAELEHAYIDDFLPILAEKLCPNLRLKVSSNYEED